MHYRGYTITPSPDDAFRWVVRDASTGAFMVSRASQNAACAWVDIYESYLANRAKGVPKPVARLWRKLRERQPPQP